MKAKSIFLSVLFALAAISGLRAQEKYDFAIVIYSNQLTPVLFVSISGKSMEKIITPKEGKVQSLDFTLMLNYIQKMSEDGWEVYNSAKEGFDLIYYLKKKKQ